MIVKQREDESLMVYIAQFNRERLTVDDQDEKILLVALLVDIWLRSPFMVELARKTPSTLREFMDRADNFFYTEVHYLP